MFHLTDNLYFERLPAGGVRIFMKEDSREDADLVFDITVDASQWSSVIASMSFYGEENYGFYRALQFHRGDPLPESVRLVEQQPDLPPVVD